MRYLFLVLFLIGCSNKTELKLAKYEPNPNKAVESICNLNTDNFPTFVIQRQMEKFIGNNITTTCKYKDASSSGRVYCEIRSSCWMTFVTDLDNLLNVKLGSLFCVKGEIDSVDLLISKYMRLTDSSFTVGKCKENEAKQDD